MSKCFNMGLLTLMLIFFLMSASAKEVRIFGEVTDNRQQPLEYVNILVKGTTYGTTTDSNGAYNLVCSIEDEKRDSIWVIFSYIGYKEVVKTIVNFKNDEIKLDVLLEEESVLLGQYEMNVYRKQDNTIDLLDVEHLRTMPSASGGGIESLISTQAGVSMNNELSSQYSVRGGNYDENCVYVNSIEIYRPLLIRSGEQEGLSFVNPDMVESVAFSSGGFGVQYGDKMASVLDIKYKQPTKFEGSVSLSLLGATAYLGTSSNKFSQMHGLRYKTASYMLGALETDGEYNPNFIDYQTYITYQFSPKWQLNFLGNVSRNSYEFIPKSRETSFGTMTDVKSFTVYFDGREKDLFMTYFGSLALKYQPTKKTELELLSSAFHTAEDVSYDITGSYWLSESGGESSFNAASGVGTYHEHARNGLRATVFNLSHLGNHKSGNNELRWGCTYQRETVLDKINEWEWRDSAGYSLPLDPTAMTLFNNVNSDLDMYSNRISAYIQDRYNHQSLRGKMIFEGGVRMSYWDYNSEWLISPRISFAFFPKKNSNWGFRFASGIYYQSLFYKEMRQILELENGNQVVVLNKDIKSPRSYQLLFASDYYFRKWDRPFKFSAEVYGKYIDRIIPYLVDNTQVTYLGKNCADGYAYGVDLKLFGEFVPGTDSWVSFSYMKTEENIYGDEVGYIPRPTDQRYNISLFFQDYFPKFKQLKFNLKLIWSDGLPFGPPQNIKYKSAFRMNDYRRVDLGATYQLTRGVDRIMAKKFFSWMKTLSFNLDLFNLLDIDNENSFYWVTDAYGQQYAVPNYLTGRRINFKIAIDF